jgi:hypothetical protein
MDALSDVGDDVDANLIRTCTDAANQADLAVKRLKELATACRAVKMPEPRRRPTTPPRNERRNEERDDL